MAGNFLSAPEEEMVFDAAAFRRRVGLFLVLALVLCGTPYALTNKWMADGRQAGRDTTTAIYDLARAGDYDEISRRKLVSAAGIERMKEADSVLGKILSFKVGRVGSQILGTPWYAYVTVSRATGTYQESSSGHRLGAYRVGVIDEKGQELIRRAQQLAPSSHEPAATRAQGKAK